MALSFLNRDLSCFNKRILLTNNPRLYEDTQRLSRRNSPVWSYYQLQNSANNYGLATNSLRPSVASQSNGTSGDSTSGDSTSGDKIYIYNSYLHRKVITSIEMSDKNGNITTIPGIKIVNCKKNTLYTVMYAVYECRSQPEKFCDSQKKDTELILLSNGDGSTSGDGTN